MKKIISIIITTATILSLTAGIFLYRPQKAQAIFGIGDITIDIVQQVKTFILDTLPRTIARQAMVRMQQEVARWAQGGFTDQNAPFAMTDWNKELKDIANVATGRFIQDIKATALCGPVAISIGTMFGVNMPVVNVPYTQYAACSMENVVDNVKAFWENPSIRVYGWDSWTALTQPNNNVMGAYLMAQQHQAEIAANEKESKQQEVAAGSGIKNDAVCTQTDQEACAKTCNDTYSAFTGPIPNPLFVACMKSCEKSSIGACLQKQVKKTGSEIGTAVNKAIGAETDWLLSAKEISDMFDLVFSSLMNKLTQGVNGMLTKAFYNPSDTVAKNQADYSYYKQYKKAQTPEDLKNLKSGILQNILSSIKSLTTSGYSCDTAQQLKGDAYAEVAAEILDQESQHLYTALEGVNLKSDFQVLDGPQAVSAGIAIYGQTWDDIPFARYPEKCATIANSKCSNIVNGLPYELEVNKINTECGDGGCLSQINDYRSQGETDANAINKAVTDGKCSSYNIGNSCLQGAYLIDRTKTYCGDCVKKYQESCELKSTPEEVQQCLESACGNYADVSSSITSAQDFYNRCAKDETKYSCNVCLKEYFMPADYCEQTYDYVNRAFVKYPALVYDNTWWGGKNDFSQGKCNPSGSSGQRIFTGLICRIMPDSLPACKTSCKATADELKDITDNKPSDADCTPKEISVGAYHPGGQYIPYLVRKKAKCCPALTGNQTSMYKYCRDQEIQAEPPCTYAKPVDQEPWCYCNDGFRPLGFGRTGDTGTPIGSKAPMGGDCHNINVQADGNPIYIYSNNGSSANPATDMLYFGGTGCTETNESVNNNDRVYDPTCKADPSQCQATDAVPGTGALWSQQGPFKDLIGIDVPAGAYNAGVYHADNDTVTTGIHVCTQCNPSDSQYPYYGVTDESGNPLDQCSSKIQ